MAVNAQEFELTQLGLRLSRQEQSIYKDKFTVLLETRFSATEYNV